MEGQNNKVDGLVCEFESYTGTHTDDKPPKAQNFVNWNWFICQRSDLKPASFFYRCQLGLLHF